MMQFSSVRSSPSMACRLPYLGARSQKAVYVAPTYSPQRWQKTTPRAAAPATEAAQPETASVGFKNVQRFLVPDEAEAPFQEAWKMRAEYMETMEGFVSLNITQSGQNFSVESSWVSIPEWEKFNLSAEARRQHLPSGIWQYVPKPGEGFPEDFVPFFDMNVAVAAKYPKKKK